MEATQVSLKLHYVVELLDDLWHYHQAGAHTCPCNVCQQKQSLARSIIDKALQEVSLIANCFESSNNYDVKEKPRNNSAVLFNYSCGALPQDQDAESTALKGSSFQRSHNSSDLEANCNSGMSLNNSEQTKSSVYMDSGLNTSQSSQSISPVLVGKNLHNINSSQLQAPDALSQVSSAGMVKVDEAAQNTSISDSFFTTPPRKKQAAGSEYLSNDRSVQSPTRHVFTIRNVFSDTHCHILKRRNLSLNSTSHSLQSQPANLALSVSTPQSLTLVPFPFVVPSPCFMEEKCSRVLQQLSRNPNITQTEHTSERVSFCHKVHAAQVIPLTFVQPVCTSAYSQTTSPLVHAEKNNIRADFKDGLTEVLENPLSGGECVNHCHHLMQGEILDSSRQIPFATRSTSPDKQPHCSLKKNAVSTSRQTDTIACEEHSGQQLNVTNIQSGNHPEGLLNTVLPITSLPHSSHVVALQTCDKNESIISASKSCRETLKLASSSGSQHYCQLLVCDNHEFCESSNLHDTSSFDSMWRPWEAKDMIIGLICTDSTEEGQMFPNKNGGNTNTATEETEANETIENGIKLKVLDSSCSTVCDAFSSELNTEFICTTINQKDSVRNMKPLFEGSSSGSVLVSHKINSRDSVTSISGKNVDEVIKHDQSCIEALDDSINALSELKLHSPGTDVSSKINCEKEPGAITERSLKHMSDLVPASPEKLIRSSVYQNSAMVSPKVSDNLFNFEKENENTSCSQESENTLSHSLTLIQASTASTVHNVNHVLSSSPCTKLPSLATGSQASQSKLVAEACSDNPAISEPPSPLPWATYKISSTKKSVYNSSRPVSDDRNVNMVVPDVPLDARNPAKSKHIQWGAPSVVVEHNSTVKETPENIAKADMSQSVPHLVEQLKPELNKVSKSDRLESGLSGTKSAPNLAVKTPNTRNSGGLVPPAKSGDKIKECVKLFHEESVDEPIQVTKRKTSITQCSKICLNQTLPARETPALKDKQKSERIMNESYEGNQSFPKMTRSQQALSAVKGDQTAAAVCGQDCATDLHQLFQERTAEPAPRNRRSIFGFSPPDFCISQRLHETDVEHETKQPQQPLKSVKCPNEFDFKNLWSLLDASDDIGLVPSAQEVLFNCVTSCLCVVDPDRSGKIISVNESFQFLIGVHEKIVGQRLFRFIKFPPSGSSLGLSLSQSIILADGHLASVTGKLAYCINASGEPIAVSVWTVPFKPQPKLTMCVIGVSLGLQADVYLHQGGNVLMYSEPLEDILGLTKEAGKGVVRIPDLDFSQVDKPQHTSLQATDGCDVAVTVTLTVDSDTSLDKETLETDSTDNGHIYPATLSVSTNMSGLLVVGSDGTIKFCDKNYFRVNLGRCRLEGKHVISELFSEIMKVSQSSSQSSASSSPALQAKLNSTSSDIALVDVSRLHREDLDNGHNGDAKESELFLPQSCFSRRWLVDFYDSIIDSSDDEESQGNSPEGVVEEAGRRHSRLILPPSDEPYQTSTPCKSGELPRNKEPREILMENGIYAAVFLHGNGRPTPVTFKLSRIQTPREVLFCLWVYIHPGGSSDEQPDSDGDNENDDQESEDEITCEEEDLTNRLRHLQFDQSVCNRVGDISLGQLLMEQAGLNQSHNATSGADMLDLEAAVDGLFGQRYMVCEALGQGSFGFVRRARAFDSAESVVVKFIKKSQMFDDSWTADVKNNKQVPLEVAILREADSEYIIKFLDFYENKSFVQMIMEDFGETDLFDFIDQVTIDEGLACYLFRQILWAVEYLHSRKIIHRDIKDENVIINRSFHCKLIDFGSATYMLPEGQLFTKFRGTMEYCSPEVYNEACYRGPELDAWALGVTLFTILFRENPFSASEVPGQLDDLPHPVTGDVLTLLLGLLQPDPLKRYTVLRAMSCDWLKQIVDVSEYNWCELFGDAPLQSESMMDIGVGY